MGPEIFDPPHSPGDSVGMIPPLLEDEPCPFPQPRPFVGI